MTDSTKTPVTLDHVSMQSLPPQKPVYSPFGYLIQADGTTHALLHRFYHGVVLALLYPDLLKEYTPDEPIEVWNEEKDEYEKHNKLTIPNSIEDINVFKFQHFEFWAAPQVPLVRISTARMITQFCLDRPEIQPTTKEQIEAVRLVVKELGLDHSDEVITDNRTMKVREMWGFLDSGKNVYDGMGADELEDE